MLKVLTWNVFWGLGAPTSGTHQRFYGLLYLRTKRDREFIPKIAAEIKSCSPDIVALQEVDNGSVRNGRFNHIEAISQTAGLPYRQFAVEKSTAKYFGDGNALLSRTPLLRARRMELPHRIERRNCVIAEAEKEGKRFVVITTHLGAHGFNADERMMQVKALCGVMRRIRMPIILLGDFNCQPSSVEFRYLLEHSGLKAIIAEPTYPVYAPEKAYDTVLVKGFKVKKAKRLPVKLSDHFPVYAELE